MWITYSYGRGFWGSGIQAFNVAGRVFGTLKRILYETSARNQDQSGPVRVRESCCTLHGLVDSSAMCRAEMVNSGSRISFPFLC